VTVRRTARGTPSAAAMVRPRLRRRCPTASHPQVGWTLFRASADAAITGALHARNEGERTARENFRPSCAEPEPEL